MLVAARRLGRRAAVHHTTVSSARRQHANTAALIPTVGQVFETVEVFDFDRVAKFVDVTGDANILHRDPEKLGWEEPPAPVRTAAIVPGSLCAALFPAIIGTALPGTLYLSQTLKFRNALPVGGKARAVVTVEKISGRRVSFDTTCKVDGVTDPEVIIVDGKAVAMLPPPA